MLSQDRRYGHRLPLELYLNAYVADRPKRGFTTNLSESGLYLNTLPHDPLPPHTPVGLEFSLPGLGDTIWAAGEMCYDALVDEYFQGTGIRFVAMANRHERMLRDYLKVARSHRFEVRRRRA